MSEEIKGMEGDLLVEEALADVGMAALVATKPRMKKRKYLKKTAVLPKELVEGMLIQTMTQFNNAMNSIFLIFFDKETGDKESFNTQQKKLDAVKGTHYIFMSELETIVHCLTPYKDANLNHKHRAVRRVAIEGHKRLGKLTEGLKEAKQMNHSSVNSLAKELCLFTTNFHVTLHQETPSKERRRVVKEYCE